MTGFFLIGSREVERPETFCAQDPATGEALRAHFSISTAEDVAEACRLADEALDTFRELDPEARARFLETVAEQIEARRDRLVDQAMLESGLPRARLTGECARTTGQLRMFADVLRQGRWAGIVFDTPQPDRKPAPRPDLRQRRTALGPVAVFGASNFPLAFSVAGGDTASALAAGCPVVVKGHPAHPGVSLLAGEAIRDAVQACGLPEGVFSLVQGPGNEIGAAVVNDPRIKAVGFTGSRAGGLALVRLAQNRPEPIPVYAEMSSVNPVILFPAALQARAETLGAAYIASMTLGAGQFCTNPGIVLAPAGPGLERFEAAAARALAAHDPQVMLTSGIHAAYRSGIEKRSGLAAVQTLGWSREAAGCNQSRGALFAADGNAFLQHPELAEEVFGAASVIVRCKDVQQAGEVVAALEGQLTITLQIDEADHGAAAALMPLLERKAGRLLANGWPTGVEVSYAMVHGGPFPATSDARSTSVGAAAIERFLRPVCYQDLPERLLPKALRDTNPLDLPRLINTSG